MTPDVRHPEMYHLFGELIAGRFSCYASYDRESEIWREYCDHELKLWVVPTVDARWARWVKSDDDYVLEVTPEGEWAFKEYELAGLEGAGGAKGKKRTGRPKATEKGADALVLAALLLHHGYKDGAVTNPTAATNRGLAVSVNADLKPGQKRIAGNALHRFLSLKGKTHEEYVTACNKGTIHIWLANWRGELLSHLPKFLDTGKSRYRYTERHGPDEQTASD